MCENPFVRAVIHTKMLRMGCSDSTRMKIIADAHIPFVEDIFSELGEVCPVAGHKITADSVRSADMLVIRSITCVNRALLDGSRIKFVGTTTSGLDHVDQRYLKSRNIDFASAPGANAESVVEYVLASLAELGLRSEERFTARSIGIIGCGHVGGLLAQRCSFLGMSVFMNDPPRAEKGIDTDFVSLAELLEISDIISVHTPLSLDGPHATRGLIGEAQLSAAKSGVWFVQTSRGGVCNETDLISARHSGRLCGLVLDVWENEPTPSALAIDSADIATGHIAGYSVDARRCGVIMIRNAAVRSMKLELEILETTDYSGSGRPCDFKQDLNEQIRLLYDVREDDSRFRAMMFRPDNLAEAFHSYRGNYPVRRAFSTFRIAGEIPESRIAGLALSFESVGT